MRMLLYKPGCDPQEVDVKASELELSAIVGTREYEWMTVRMLGICVIHDSGGKAAGKKLNRMLGMTPIYGDFLVCGITWDNDGNTSAISLADKQVALLKDIVFNKFPQGDDVAANLPSYARRKREQDS